MEKKDHLPLKLGFIGLGKYGWGVLRAILKAGYHDQKNIFFEEEDPCILRNVARPKREEIKKNYISIKKFFQTHGESHCLPINDLIQEIGKDKNCLPVLIVSLDRERADKIFQRVRKLKGVNWNDIWLLSSVSCLTAQDIKRQIHHKVKVIRYIPNLATMVGEGIITAYVEPQYQDEGMVILRKVFHDLGKVVVVQKEQNIDSARLITGSTIGLAAYFAKLLSDSIRALRVQGLGRRQEDADEIVFHAIVGMLALRNSRNEGKTIQSWGDFIEFIQVTKSRGNKPGTTESLIELLDQKRFPEIVKKAIREVHAIYLESCSKPRRVSCIES